MSHSGLCSIWHNAAFKVISHSGYVVWHSVAFGVMSFGIMSHWALCHIQTYAIRRNVLRRNVVRVNVVQPTVGACVLPSNFDAYVDNKSVTAKFQEQIFFFLIPDYSCLLVEDNSVNILYVVPAYCLHSWEVLYLISVYIQ